jgi:dolichol-phosphate mannosyltransferase
VTGERSVAIIVPALDELPNLRNVVPAAIHAMAPLPGVRSTVLVVVGRGCSDADRAEIRELGAHPIDRAPTDSFGDAIRSGIRACPPDTDVVIFMDADGSHDPATLPRLLAEADSADIVIASRYVKGGRSDNGLALRAMSRSLNLAYGLVLGIHCRDISTNFKLFHHADIQDVTLTCRNFDVVEELLFRVRQAKGASLRVREIPDYFHERDQGETKRSLGPFVASYVGTLIRLRFKG